MRSAKTAPAPRDPAYDRAYYRAYGIDPDKVMPRPRRTISTAWPTPDGLSCDVWPLRDGRAALVEDPNGPHPVAYVYERRDAWRLSEVRPLTGDQAQELAGKSRLGGTDAAMVYVAFRSDMRRDLSAYLVDENF